MIARAWTQLVVRDLILLMVKQPAQRVHQVRKIQIISDHFGGLNLINLGYSCASTSAVPVMCAAT